MRFISVAISVFLVASCGGSGSGNSRLDLRGNGQAKVESPESSLLDRAESYYAASVENPAKLYDFFTAACREQLSKSDFAGQILLGSSLFESMYGFRLSDLEIKNVRAMNVTAASGQTQADAFAPDGSPIEASEVTDWVFEDGEWRTSNDCDFDDSGN